MEVDLASICGNARAALEAAGAAARLVPMVKADAYGLGAPAVVEALSAAFPGEIHAFGVAAVSEGEALRRQGWTGRVIVFSPTPPGEMERAAEAGLTLALSDEASIDDWCAVATSRGERLPFHLEVDTGMGRAGLPWTDVAERAAAVVERVGEALRWDGLFTHFHSADEPDLGPTDQQWTRFREAVAALPAGVREGALLHAANSAATLRRGGYACDLVRPGIYLYGGEAGPGVRPLPVAALRARIALVKEVPAGSSVGYGATYTARGPERWATLAIGYGDGLRRALAEGGGEALVHGRRVPIRGRISMDVTVVDVTGVPEAAPGDVCTLIGRDGDEEIRVDEVAARCRTISYEILTGLTPRLPRVYTGAPSADDRASLR